MNAFCYCLMHLLHFSIADLIAFVLILTHLIFVFDEVINIQVIIYDLYVFDCFSLKSTYSLGQQEALIGVVDFEDALMLCVSGRDDMKIQCFNFADTT